MEGDPRPGLVAVENTEAGSGPAPSSVIKWNRKYRETVWEPARNRLAAPAGGTQAFLPQDRTCGVADMPVAYTYRNFSPASHQ
jgi:hypothetical protein